MITQDNVSPRTSTPSQKLPVPSNTALPRYRKRSQQLTARRLALYQQRVRHAADRAIRLAQGAVAGKSTKARRGSPVIPFAGTNRPRRPRSRAKQSSQPGRQVKATTGRRRNRKGFSQIPVSASSSRAGPGSDQSGRSPTGWRRVKQARVSASRRAERRGGVEGSQINTEPAVVLVSNQVTISMEAVAQSLTNSQAHLRRDHSRATRSLAAHRIYFVRARHRGDAGLNSASPGGAEFVEPSSAAHAAPARIIAKGRRTSDTALSYIRSQAG